MDVQLYGMHHYLDMHQVKFVIEYKLMENHQDYVNYENELQELGL